MEYSRGTNKSGAMTDDKFKQLLATITTGLNPFKLEATFTITLGKSSIEEVIEYSKATGIKLWKGSIQYLPIHFNFTGGEVNQFIEALRERSHKMGWNSHPTSSILTISDGNGTDLNLFVNYFQLSASDSKTPAKTHVNADII